MFQPGLSLCPEMLYTSTYTCNPVQANHDNRVCSVHIRHFLAHYMYIHHVPLGTAISHYKRTFNQLTCTKDINFFLSATGT